MIQATPNIAHMHGAHIACLHNPSDFKQILGTLHKIYATHALMLVSATHLRHSIWAAWYNTWLLIGSTPQDVMFSFLFFAV